MGAGFGLLLFLELHSLSSFASFSLHHTDCASVDFFSWSSGEAPIERHHALTSSLKVETSSHTDDTFVVDFAHGAVLVDVLAVAHFELVEALRQ